MEGRWKADGRQMESRWGKADAEVKSRWVRELSLRLGARKLK